MFKNILDSNVKGYTQEGLVIIKKFRIKILILFLLKFAFGSVYSESKFPMEVLQNPISNKHFFDSTLNVIEKEKIETTDFYDNLILKCDYSDYEIKNPIVWEGHKDIVIPSEVTIVFSKYPIDLNKWKTNYYELLASRLKSLFSLAPELNNSQIKFSIIHQLKIETEAKAKESFHGYFIRYKYKDESLNSFTYHDFNPIRIKRVDTIQVIKDVPTQSGTCGIYSDEIQSIIEYDNKIWFSVSGKGVYYSNDTGITFVDANKGFVTPYIFNLCVHKGKLFATEGANLYCYEKGSNSWNLVKEFAKKLNIQYVVSNNEKIVLAVSADYKLYVSDNGFEWSELEIKLTKGDIIVKKTIGASNAVFYNKHLLVSSGGNVYHTMNDGDSWRQIHFDETNTKSKYVTGLAFNSTLIFIGTIDQGAFVSRDKTQSWQNLGFEIGKEISSVFEINEQVYFGFKNAGTQKGLIVIEEDGSMIKIVTGMRSISLCKFGDYLFLGSYGGVFLRLKLE